MKPLVILLALLGAAGGLGSLRAQAQCHVGYVPTYAYHTHHCHDSCAVKRPFVPKRVAGYLGLLGAADRQGTPYLGGDLEAYYWLRPRWATGLRSTVTGKMPVPNAPAERYAGTSQPLLQLFSVTWNNTLLLADAPRWRLTLQVGAGLGGVNLYDKARQVQAKGQRCGCTTAERMASATAPVTEVGLAATYKPKRPDGPWLTVRGGYRQWNGAVPFGTFNQFSAYVVSLGITMPDVLPKRK